MVPRRLFIGGAVTFVASANSVRAEDKPFAVGQEWTFSGGVYPEARIIVSKFDTINGKHIVLISVLDVPARDTNGVVHPQVISLLPFKEGALRKSVGKLLSTDHPLFEHFNDSYVRFKAAGGTASDETVQEVVANIIPMMEQSLR